MKKINKYAQDSALMKISIQHGSELYEFSLFEELQINESIIAKEIKEQPTSYAFLAMLQTKLSEKWSMAKVNEEKVYNELYLRYKKKINTQTNRPNSDDVAKAEVGRNPIYLKAQEKTIKLSKQFGTIANCVRSFEQRSSLLQTLSANKRKENN